MDFWFGVMGFWPLAVRDVYITAPNDGKCSEHNQKAKELMVWDTYHTIRFILHCNLYYLVDIFVFFFKYFFLFSVVLVVNSPMITLTSVKSPMFLLVRLFIFLFHFLFSNIDWSCVAFVDLSCTFLVELPDARESRNDFVACFTPSTCNRGAFVCFRWCSTDDVFHIHLFCPPTADAF